MHSLQQTFHRMKVHKTNLTKISDPSTCLKIEQNKQREMEHRNQNKADLKFAKIHLSIITVSKLCIYLCL